MPHEAIYDPEAHALYLRSSDKPIARTIQLGSGLLIDLDASDSVVGIEIISPTPDQLALGQDWVDETTADS